MNNERKLIEYQDIINSELEKSIKISGEPYAKVLEAMKYSLSAGGKRIRPVLVLEFAKIFGADAADVLPFAVAIEMIHTYSLIHDDLPCMDDDDMRRGRPTNHKVFGESTAVLAGDALLNRAFEHILKNTGNVPPVTVLRALKCLSECSGADGMIGGQIIDLEGENRELSEPEMLRLIDLKTGALIRASVLMGCILGGADETDMAKAKVYADKIGLAFQIKDDILNVEGDSAVIGKDVGNDEKSGKSTFVGARGLNECKKWLNELTEDAVLAIRDLPNSDFLVWLAYHLLAREK